MILTDTSVWIDHLRAPDPIMTDLLVSSSIGLHPFVIGELAVGNLKDRGQFLADLATFALLDVASHEEAMALLENHRLYGRGVGWVDINLLATAKLLSGYRLWTRDLRLLTIARELGCAAPFDV